jgi:PHD/YefM family antitoxin component YafN of YafNO toxin-antitoxin module
VKKKISPTLEISEARKKLTSIDERLEKEPVIYVTRHNKKAFAVVSLEFLANALDTLKVLKNPAALQMMEMMKAYHSIQSMSIPAE